MSLSRRAVLGAAAGTVAALAGCAAPRDQTRDRWHDGRLYLATGNTTGVFYQIGGGYADVITKHLPGYEATAEPTNAAVENIRRLARGDADIALTFADAAADAVTGRGPFADTPQPIQALARIYNSYVHVIARTGTGIRDIKDMRGHRISTGSPGSGTENVALRLLAASGVQPDRDITRLSQSLPSTVKGMKGGTIDAMFWTAGLPTLGISDLMGAMRDKVVFLPVAPLLPELRREYGEAYTPAAIARTVYGQSADVPTIAVASLVIVGTDLPEPLGFDLTRLLFTYQDDLAKAHPEGRNFTRTAAPQTEPVPLHPGARRYYAGPTGPA
jgi:TRAP transporter TAXI family solute receptor